MLTGEDSTVAVLPSNIPAPGVGVLPYILLPLAGPEEFDLEDQEKLPESLQMLPPDKKREPDTVLRLTHVETLLLLCHTRWGRDYLREHGTYEIVRAAHEVETEDRVSLSSCHFCFSHFLRRSLSISSVWSYSSKETNQLLKR